MNIISVAYRYLSYSSEKMMLKRNYMYTAWFPRVFAYFYLRIHYLQFQPTNEFISRSLLSALRKQTLLTAIYNISQS